MRTLAILGAAAVCFTLGSTTLAADAPAAPAAAAPATQPSRADYKPGKVERIVPELQAEALKAIAENKPFPRPKATYADDKKLTLPDEDLIRLLSRRLQSDKRVEGYIKQQLMSFRPDLSKGSANELKRIIILMPELFFTPDAPAPGGAGSGAPGMNMNIQAANIDGSGGVIVGGRQRAVVTGLQPIPGTQGQSRPVLGVVNSGTGVTVQGTVSADHRYVTSTINAQQADLIQLRQITVNANSLIVDTRNNIAAAMPEAAGFRFATMLQDLNDRLRVGDPSYKDLLPIVIAASDGVPQIPDIAPDIRTRMVGNIKGMANVHTRVATDVREVNGQPQVVYETYSIPRDDLMHLAKNVFVGNDKLEFIEVRGR